MAETRLSAVLIGPWQALTRRLDAAMGAGGGLAGARDVLTRPIELFQLLAADAPAALGEDPLRGDRYRTLLHLIVPYGALVEQAGGLGDDAGDSDSDGVVTVRAALPALRLPEVMPYEPGVLDHGALPLLALAAMRVGQPELVPLFVRGLHGLALAASVAEVLGRLDPELPDEEALAVVVRTLHLLETLSSALRMPYLRTFALDPIERGRWRCLGELFSLQRLEGLVDREDPPWDGAHIRRIQEVRPGDALPGADVELRGSFSFLRSDAGTVRFPDDTRVVFAAPGGVRVPARVVSIDQPSEGDDVIVVEVPAGASPGWIGFSVDPDVKDANDFRQELREALTREFVDDACLIGTRVPVEVIPDIGTPDPERAGQLLALPPRRATNRFGGGAPLMLHATVLPEIVEPGAAISLSWEASGADEVQASFAGKPLAGGALGASGTTQLRAPLVDGAIDVVMTPVARRAGRTLEGPSLTLPVEVRAPAKIRAVTVSQDGRESGFWEQRPLDVTVELSPPTSRSTGRLIVSPAAGQGGEDTVILPEQDGRPGLRFVIPAASVRNRLLFTVEIARDPEAPALDRRSIGPLAIGVRRAATVVLFRVTVLEPEQLPVSRARAEEALVAAARERGLDLEVLELPWADDELAVLPEPLRASDDPAVPALLEALAGRALVTPGLERALCLALVPGERRRGIAALATSAASLAVAVGDLAGLGELLDRAFDGVAGEPAPAPEPDPVELRALARAAAAETTYLRFLAQLRDGQLISYQVVREARLAGRGGAVPSDYELVSFDGRGRELRRYPIMLVHPARPDYLEALVPANGDVAALALLRDGQRVLHVQRPDGQLEIGAAQLTDEPQQRVTWDIGHSGGVRPRLTLSARSGDVVTPVATLDDCGGRDLVFLDRLGPVDGLELFVSDGWSAQAADLGRELPPRDRVALRQLPDGRWYAEAPSDWQVAWKLDDQVLPGNQRLRRLPDDAEGMLMVQATSQSGDVRVDARIIEPGPP